MSSLVASGVAAPRKFLTNKEVDKLANPLSLGHRRLEPAAVAGVTMVAARRSALLAGPLRALVLIPSAAMAGAAAAIGEGGSFSRPSSASGSTSL